MQHSLVFDHFGDARVDVWVTKKNISTDLADETYPKLKGLR